MDTPGTTATESPSKPRTRAPARILVAEDDEAMRSVVVETLRKDGHDVSCVHDGGRLLVKLAREHMGGEGADTVDLLVSDVRMPVCSGLQILQQLRAVRCRIPVILVTAFGDEETRKQARSLGATLLDKPFELEELRATVAKLLG
jgi:DNA-binding response OmpR family regulator